MKKRDFIKSVSILSILPIVFCLIMAYSMALKVSAANGWMSEKKPYQYTGVTEYMPNEDKYFSIGGTQYDEGYVFGLWNAAGTSQVLYNLKNGYTNFSFKVGHIDNTSSYTAALKIYLDGVLSQTIQLAPSDIAKNVSVDLSGVKSMKIQMTSEEELYHYNIYYGIYGGVFTTSGEEIATSTTSNMIGNKEPYQTEGDKTKVVSFANRESIQMAGDEFTDCLQMYLWNPARKSKFYFNFNGEYESMSFLFGHIDNTSRVNAKLEIIADGEVVNTVSMNADSLPTPVTVPLKGVYQVVLSLLSDAALNNYDIYYGIGGIQLKSNGKVRGVVLNQTSVTLTDDNPSMKLKPTVVPDDAKNTNVNWSSSNPEIVTVDQDGVIKAISNGEAVITVTTEEGEYKATCAVATSITTPTATPVPTETPGKEPAYDAKGLVERFYTELLGRDGEADGIESWTEQLETEALSAIFVGYLYVDGDEFKNLNLTNDEYLERLYRTFMNRDSDAGGKAYWLERLDAGFTRDYVYLNFAVLDEFTEICEKSHIRRGEVDEVGNLKEAGEAYANKNLNVSQYVTRCYTKVLNRPADAGGVEFWCGQIITKTIEAKTAAEAYVLSEEFVKRNTTDEEYVEVLYQTFFGRAGDEAGTGYWLGQLSSKAMSREDVLHAFSGTPEFAGILAGFGL